jgi:hypothetical protein
MCGEQSLCTLSSCSVTKSSKSQGNSHHRPVYVLEWSWVSCNWYKVLWTCDLMCPLPSAWILFIYRWPCCKSESIWCDGRGVSLKIDVILGIIEPGVDAEKWFMVACFPQRLNEKLWAKVCYINGTFYSTVSQCNKGWPKLPPWYLYFFRSNGLFICEVVIEWILASTVLQKP